MGAPPPPWPLPRRVLKRALDVGLSGAALSVLAPGLVAIGALVRLGSPGPALFRQERMGRGGRPFAILKFRTMVDGAARIGPAVTAGGDPRVTPLGRVLRRTKLDELPQLWNVLVGDMSLVGPRPEVRRYVERYPEAYARVLAVRPGVTDLASIAFRDEESVLARYPDRERAYVEELLPQKLALAEEYLRTQGTLGDVAILLRTFGAIAR